MTEQEREQVAAIVYDVAVREYERLMGGQAFKGRADECNDYVAEKMRRDLVVINQRVRDRLFDYVVEQAFGKEGA